MITDRQVGVEVFGPRLHGLERGRLPHVETAVGYFGEPWLVDEPVVLRPELPLGPVAGERYLLDALRPLHFDGLAHGDRKLMFVHVVLAFEREVTTGVF